MSNYKKNINRFKILKNKYYKSISIVGGGRWAQTYLLEIIENFKNIRKIYVYTNYHFLIKNLIRKKKIKNIKIHKLDQIKKIDSKYVIISNKNKDHIKFVKLLIALKCNILVEKTFPLSLKNFQNLLNSLKKNKIILQLSSQYFFANYFHYIKKRIIGVDKVKKIKIDWYDALYEKRHGHIKKHDLKINFLDDIFYHLNSILCIFLGNEVIDIREKVQIGSSFDTVKFNYKDTEINIRFTRVAPKRKRQIIVFLKKAKIIINFSNDEKILLKYNNKNIKIPNFVCQKTLKFQIFNFLNSNFLNSKKNENDLMNLKNFYISLNKLKKYT